MLHQTFAQHIAIH